MKISVIIPTYNRAKTVVHALQSVLWQTHPKVEIIVVDDGSDDETTTVLEPFSDRILYLRQCRRGPSAARNAGAAASSGEWLAFLDSDDLWLPWHLSEQLALLAKLGPEVPCCVANAWILRRQDGCSFTSFSDAGLVLHDPDALLLNPMETLAGRFLLFNQTATIRRAAFERAEGYDESLCLLEDYDLALKIARQAPWALIRAPSVVKPNEPDGLGVTCMSDASRHHAAKRHLLEQVIADPTLPRGLTAMLLRLALRSTPASDRARTAFIWSAIHRAVRLLARPVMMPPCESSG